MPEESKESRIKVEDLPQDPQELTSEEAKEVRGGLANIQDQTLKAGGNFGDTPGLNGGDMVAKMSQ
jgi:hypothetical protein